MDQADEYAKARGRAEAKYRFFVHAGAYTAVMVLLVIINLLTTPQEPWFVWPLIGWGLAVALHGVQAFLLADKNAVIDALTEREMRHTPAANTDGGPQ